MNARVRAVLDLARNHVGLGGDRHVYIMEQVTRAFVWMQQHLHCEVTGSEFESDSRKRLVLSDYLHRIGGVGSIEFNDVTCSRYEDSTFDAVVSFEVLEHVPNYPSALAELSRNLKDGGLLIATFPFADTQETIVRARLDEQGKVEHLLEPEYHGDTISGGILCWYHFGWDILDACAKNGFRRAKMVMPWNPAAGMHFGHWILMAIK
ncbi:MAG: methyltransferase domain-containing protein [Luteimonas sp.]